VLSCQYLCGTGLTSTLPTNLYGVLHVAVYGIVPLRAITRGVTVRITTAVLAGAGPFVFKQ